jgi:hypothetical protein
MTESFYRQYLNERATLPVSGLIVTETADGVSVRSVRGLAIRVVSATEILITSEGASDDGGASGSSSLSLTTNRDGVHRGVVVR